MTFYRGFKVSSEELQSKYVKDNLINLNGFASTTYKRSSAEGFALEGLQIEDDPNKNPILLKIEFTGSNQSFSLNTNEYSAYPDEEEVLLQEGIQYKVISIN